MNWFYHKDCFLQILIIAGRQSVWFDEQYNKSGWLPVTIPGAWDHYNMAYWGYEGVAWYSLTCPWQSEWSDTQQFLHLQRIGGHAKVWVNGYWIGEHIGSYMPCRYDITSHLRTDLVNQIVIRVDNVPKEHWLPGGLLIEWMQYGGLIQPVTIESKSMCMIDDCTVQAIPYQLGEHAEVNCVIKLSQSGMEPFEGELQADIVIHNKKYSAYIEVAVQPGQQQQEYKLTIATGAVELWSPDTPYLYDLKVHLADNDKQIYDERSLRLGFRTIEVREREICLNGKPLLIKGVNRYDEVAGYGTTVPEDVIRADLMKIKLTGANCIRTHYPQDPIHLQIMDEIGLLQIEELPLNWWLKPWEPEAEVDEVLHNGIIDTAEAFMPQWIHSRSHHPCVIMWSMCNESGTNKPYGIEAVRRLMRRARELDPTRLVSFVAIGHTEGHEAFQEADVVCINLYYGSVIAPLAYHIDELAECAAEPTAKHLQQMRERFPDKPLVVTEFGMQAVAGMHGDQRYAETFHAAYIASVWEAIRSVEGVQGGVIWSWADYHHRRTLIGEWPVPFGPGFFPARMTD